MNRLHLSHQPLLKCDLHNHSFISFFTVLEICAISTGNHEKMFPRVCYISLDLSPGGLVQCTSLTTVRTYAAEIATACRDLWHIVGWNSLGMQDSDCWWGHIDCRYDLFSRDLMLMTGPGGPGESLCVTSDSKKLTTAWNLYLCPFPLVSFFCFFVQMVCYR